MYGLKESVDLSFLINAEITQVALGKHDIQIAFGEQSNITAQCQILFEQSAGTTKIDGKNGRSAGSLSGLLGDVVENIQISNRDELILRLKSGNILRLFDSSRHYESFVVWHNGDFIAV
jgi:hypothetical protein